MSAPILACECTMGASLHIFNDPVWWVSMTACCLGFSLHWILVVSPLCWWHPGIPLPSRILLCDPVLHLWLLHVWHFPLDGPYFLLKVEGLHGEEQTLTPRFPFTLHIPSVAKSCLFFLYNIGRIWPLLSVATAKSLFWCCSNLPWWLQPSHVWSSALTVLLLKSFTSLAAPTVWLHSSHLSTGCRCIPTFSTDILFCLTFKAIHGLASPCLSSLISQHFLYSITQTQFQKLNLVISSNNSVGKNNWEWSWELSGIKDRHVIY